MKNVYGNALVALNERQVTFFMAVSQVLILSLPLNQLEVRTKPQNLSIFPWLL